MSDSQVTPPLSSQEQGDEDEEWSRRIALAPLAKKSTTRLLDMLAGWERFASSDGFPDSEAALEQISRLYQEAEELASNSNGLTAKETQTLIQVLLVERVLPTLIM